MALSPAQWLSGVSVDITAFTVRNSRNVQQTLLPSGRQGPASGDHRPGRCQR